MDLHHIYSAIKYKYCHMLNECRCGLDWWLDLLHTYNSELEVTIMLHKSL
jgi:hypothetical protein